MKFEPLTLDGALRIFQARHEDERGFFARTYCRDSFLERGLKDCSVQCSISMNARRGTLRGMHFQNAPHAETKLVRCSRGAIFDAIVDIRPDSESFGRWHGEVLSAENGVMFYIPQGFAHGFLTLTDDVEVDYQMAEAYVSGHAAGFRWNDPEVAIEWPEAPQVVNDKDRALPFLSALEL